jgi:PAS domain S-box-containing protein
MAHPNDERLLRLHDLDIDALLEGVRHAVIVVEAATGRILLWNQMACEVFGYSSEEALAMNVEDLVPARVKERYRAEMSRHRETGHALDLYSGTTLELPAVKQGGEEICVELTLSSVEPTHESGAQGRLVLGAIRDVTERKKSEEARRLNEELGERVAAIGAEL